MSKTIVRPRYLLLMSFVLLTVFSISFLPAESAEAKEPMSLREAVQEALQNNHEIVAFRSSLSARKEDIGIAKSNLLPKLTFEERYLRTNNPVMSCS